MNEELLLKRLATIEQRISALELVAQRYADIKPKLDHIHQQLTTLAPIVTEYMKQTKKEGEKIAFQDTMEIN